MFSPVDGQFKDNFTCRRTFQDSYITSIRFIPSIQRQFLFTCRRTFQDSHNLIL